MDLFQKIGEGAGSLVGGALSGVVNIAAEVTNAEMLREASQEILSGNRQAGQTLGKTVDGVLDVAGGFVRRDSEQLADGKEKLTTVTKTAVVGVKNSLDFATEQVSEAYEGGKEMDGQRLLKVARNTGKVLVVSAAVVSVVKVGKGLKFKL